MLQALPSGHDARFPSSGQTTRAISFAWPSGSLEAICPREGTQISHRGLGPAKGMTAGPAVPRSYGRAAGLPPGCRCGPVFFAEAAVSADGKGTSAPSKARRGATAHVEGALTGLFLSPDLLQPDEQRSSVRHCRSPGWSRGSGRLPVCAWQALGRPDTRCESRRPMRSATRPQRAEIAPTDVQALGHCVRNGLGHAISFKDRVFPPQER